jgi:hypothetical protein
MDHHLTVTTHHGLIGCDRDHRRRRRREPVDDRHDTRAMVAELVRDRDPLPHFPARRVDVQTDLRRLLR